VSPTIEGKKQMTEPERRTTIGEELGQFLDSHQTARENLSGEIAEPLRQRSHGREPKDVQVQNASELTMIRRDLRRISRQLLISNIITTPLLIFIGTVLAFSSLHSRSPSEAELQTNQTVERDATAEATNEFSSLPLLVSREPLSPDDRAIYPLLYDLYLRARGFRQLNPPGTGSALNGRREQYVQFLTDAAKLAERAAEKSISQDLLQLIVKITELAKENYQHIGLAQPPAINLDNEIRAVLREYTPREDGRLDPRRM
jgi:hypothetical protein